MRGHHKGMMGAMKSSFGPLGRFLVIGMLLVAAAVGMQASAEDSAAGASSVEKQLPGAQDFMKQAGLNITVAKTGDLMSGSKSCVKHSWTPTPTCCQWCCSHGSCWCCNKGTKFEINYWEPSEIIEVSCRSGYSMVKPGGVKARGEASLQSCVGFNKPGNSRWFFEARSWAINGYDGGLRHQAMGGTTGEQVRQCTMQAGDDLPWPGYESNVAEGYGIKWTKWTRGSRNGPAGSWEGYISDNDPSWAKDSQGAAALAQIGADGAANVKKPGECAVGSKSLENCWGPVIESGWVTHPNPSIAAALVAWRAHEKARKANKVSPAGQGGYKMAMEFPFVNYAGDFGKSMGLPGGSKKNPDKCFEPGDSGPDWWGGKKPDDIPTFLQGLKAGDTTATAEVNSGVYIFTIWVYTSCTRYQTQFGKPTPLCHYNGKS